MARLLQDLQYGIRSFAKAPAFTVMAVTVMALGIGANAAIFTIVNELMFRSLSGYADDLVGVYSHDRTVPDSHRAFSYPNFVDIRESADLFEGLMAHTFAMVGTPAGDTTRRMFTDVVSSNYFDTLGVGLAMGRPFTADEERPGARIPVVIVSYPWWKKANLDPAFIGRTITINSRDFTVVGVTPEGFTGTMALVSAEVYLPLGMFDDVVNDVFKNKGTGLADRSNATLVLAGRLKPGLSEIAVTARLDALSRQLEAAYPGENKNQALTVSPLPRMSTSTSPGTDTGLGAFAGLLLGLSGVVLVIACLNVANMLLARGGARRKELALRLALGANRGRVVRQLLTESLALASVGAALGLVLSYWATRALGLSIAAALPLAVTFTPTPDASVLFATIGFATLATLASGLGPALKLSRRDLVADLKDPGGTGGPIGRRFGARNLMVMGQVALSLALLTAGGIFTRTAIEAASGDPGYSYERLLLASVDGALAGLGEQQGRTVNRSMLERVRAIPGVTTASMASTMPFGDTHEGELVERLGGEPGAVPVNARTKRIIGSEYFATIGLGMIRGREFTRAEEESPEAPSVAIVDELLARRLFGNEDPIEQMIRIADRPGQPRDTAREPMQIVGIAPPIRQEMLDPGPVSHLYLPSGRNYRSSMHLHVKVAPGVDGQAALAELRRAIAAADPRLPVLALSTMEGFHSTSLELWALETGARVFTALGGLALLLAVVGVYGVKSYIVSRRTKEIGIRMALGATTSDVLGLVLRQGLFLTGTGIALGLPLAVLVSIAFTKVFVQVGGFDALVVSFATVVLSLSSIAASAVPARRAAKVVTLSALRAE
jgi:predicted permease